MNKITNIQLRRLTERAIIVTIIFLSTFQLKADSETVEFDFYYTVGSVTTATEPRLECADVTPDNLVISMPVGASAELNGENFHPDGDDCDFGFAVPPNDSTFEDALLFADEGMYGLFFYILGPTANSTPLGPCPFDLEVSMSSSTGKTDLPDVAVYPTPTGGALKLDYPNYSFKYLELFDMNGVKVLEKTDSGREIDLSKFAGGMYFLRVGFEEGTLERKILKQ